MYILAKIPTQETIKPKARITGKLFKNSPHRHFVLSAGSPILRFFLSKGG
jgi:hypothetical protein